MAGVATVFVAGIAGGLAMGGSVSGVPNSLYSLATGGDDPAQRLAARDRVDLGRGAPVEGRDAR